MINKHLKHGASPSAPDNRVSTGDTRRNFLSTRSNSLSHSRRRSLKNFLPALARRLGTIHLPHSLAREIPESNIN